MFGRRGVGYILESNSFLNILECPQHLQDAVKGYTHHGRAVYCHDYIPYFHLILQRHRCETGVVIGVVKATHYVYMYDTRKVVIGQEQGLALGSRLGGFGWVGWVSTAAADLTSSADDDRFQLKSHASLGEHNLIMARSPTAPYGRLVCSSSAGFFGDAVIRAVVEALDQVPSVFRRSFLDFRRRLAGRFRRGLASRTLHGCNICVQAP